MLRNLTFSAVFLLIVSPHIKADDFVISDGTAFRAGFGGLENPESIRMNISGSNFRFGGSVSTLFGPPPPCQPCVPGINNIDTGTPFLDSSDFSSGFATVYGVRYVNFPQLGQPVPPLPFVRMQGVFSFFGSLNIPLNDPSPTLTLTAPFTMRGNLAGINNTVPNFIVLSAQLTGSGYVTMNLNRVDGFQGPLYFPTSTTYRFEAPEPASIILLSTGILGVFVALVVARRKRRL